MNFYPCKLNLLKYVINISLVSYLFWAGCTKTEQAPKNIIAEVDGRPISVEEFRLFYELDPNFGLDSTGLPALKDELFFLFDQIRALKRAEQDGLADDPVFTRAVHWEERQAMLRELFRQDVLAKVEISEDELRRKYVMDNIEIHVRHLFSKSKSDIIKLKEQLDNGKSFKDLSKYVFKDTLLARNGGDLGWIKVGELDENFAKTALALDKGQVSDIIQTRYGYHIIQLLDRKTQLMFNEDEFNRQKKSIVKKLRQQKSMQLSRQYIKDFMKELNPQPEQHVMEKLWKALVPPQENEKRTLSRKIYLTNSLLESAKQKLQNDLEKNIIRTKTGGFTLGDYLISLYNIPVSHRPSFKSLPELSYQMAVWYRDELLFKEAKKRQLDKNKTVKKEVQRFKEEQSYYYYLNQYTDNILVPDEVKKFYSTKDTTLLRNNPQLSRFATLQIWKDYMAQKALAKDLRKIPLNIHIKEKKLLEENARINWDRRIRMFMVRKPQ